MTKELHQNAMPFGFLTVSNKIRTVESTLLSIAGVQEVYSYDEEEYYID
jgi:hypothetical protein